MDSTRGNNLRFRHFKFICAFADSSNISESLLQHCCVVEVLFLIPLSWLLICNPFIIPGKNPAASIIHTATSYVSQCHTSMCMCIMVHQHSATVAKKVGCLKWTVRSNAKHSIVILCLPYTCSYTMECFHKYFLRSSMSPSIYT